MANGREQCNQPAQLGLVQVAELLPMNFVNAELHLLQQMKAAPCDSSDDVAPVLPPALANDQLGVFQAIEETSHVGDLPHQSFRNFTPAQTRRLRPAENPKHVVLRCRNPMRLQGGLEGVLQQRRRALDAEVRLLFEALEGPGLFQFYL
jgi:hypothetical protein